MNHAGDAAEQVVRLSLEGAEVAVRVAGAAAREMAVLLIAALKNNNPKLKLKGRERLTSMLRSGKALEIFSVKESDLKPFTRAAKEYGIVYCALRNVKNSPDGLCDILVKAEDAPKISRMAERYKFATVEGGAITGEPAAGRDAAQAPEAAPETASGKVPEVIDTDTLLDEFLAEPGPGEAGPHENESLKAGNETQPFSPAAAQAASESEKVLPERGESPAARQQKAKKRGAVRRPFFQGAPQNRPRSEPTSDRPGKPEGATASKPSVKGALREISAARKVKAADTPAQDARGAEGKAKANAKSAPAVTAHKQPQRSKSKPKKLKGSR